MFCKNVPRTSRDRRSHFCGPWNDPVATPSWSLVRSFIRSSGFQLQCLVDHTNPTGALRPPAARRKDGGLKESKSPRQTPQPDQRRKAVETHMNESKVSTCPTQKTNGMASWASSAACVPPSIQRRYTIRPTHFPRSERTTHVSRSWQRVRPQRRVEACPQRQGLQRLRERRPVQIEVSHAQRQVQEPRTGEHGISQIYTHYT